MQYAVAQTFDASEELLTADNFTDIRIMAIALNTSSEPLKDISGTMLPWSVASSQVSAMQSRIPSSISEFISISFTLTL